MRQHILGLAAVVAFVTLAPSGLRAQCTDGCGGPVAAGSTIAGGIFTPTSGTQQVPVNPAVASALSNASLALQNSVGAGVALIDPATGLTIPLSASQVGIAMLTGATPDVRNQVNAALSRSGASGEIISQLMNSLPGLLTNPTPGQLTTAVSAFNALVNNSTTDFLLNPPPEFGAIHAIMLQVVTAGNAAASS